MNVVATDNTRLFFFGKQPLLALASNVCSDFISKKQCKRTTLDSQHMNIIDLKEWGDYSITWRIGLLILQFFPVYPGTQLQLKSLTASVQLPPFSHGPSAQSSISWRKFKIRKIFWHILRNGCNTKFYYLSIKDCCRFGCSLRLHWLLPNTPSHSVRPLKWVSS